MTQLLPNGKQQFIDINGKPLLGGKAFHYQVGTNTPKNTYQDSDLTILNTNPVIFDARGQASIYGSGSYRQVVRDFADNLIWDQVILDSGAQAVAAVDALRADLANGTDPAKGSSLVGFIQDGTDAVPRTSQAKMRERITPMDFGAVGDGTANDGPALNKALAYIRTKVTGTNVAIQLDLCNRVYSTDISVNCTGIQSWGWAVENGTIYGRCAGKSTFDMNGSRGGTLRNFIVDGDKTQMPTNGIQAARSGTGQYNVCDNMMWDNVTTQGYFSIAGAHIYGQETTTYNHCRFWNYHKDGLAAIHTGYSSFAMSSEYMPPVTGAVSYINCKYINCDYRFLPVANIAAITGITNAATAVVTAPGHPFVNGDKVVITLVSGMNQINNTNVVISGVTASTFALTGVNSTGFGAYTSGGYAIISQTNPTVYFSRGEQHHFDTCYIVNYGTHSLQYDFIDPGHIPKSNWFDVLFEGGGSISHLEFTNVTGGEIMNDFRLDTYNTHARDYVIGHNGAGTDIISLYGCKITCQNSSVGVPPLLDLYSKYAMYDAKISVANTGVFNPALMGGTFIGHCSWLNGQTTHYNSNYVSADDGSYSTTASSSSGALGAYTANVYRRSVGNVTYILINVTITNNGTGAGLLNVALGVTAAVGASFTGSLTNGTFKGLVGQVTAGGTTIDIRNTDGAYPVITGSTLQLSGMVVRT